MMHTKRKSLILDEKLQELALTAMTAGAGNLVALTASSATAKSPALRQPVLFNSRPDRIGRTIVFKNVGRRPEVAEAAEAIRPVLLRTRFS